MVSWRWLTVAVLLGSAGCGGLATPDLAHGAVQGRVVGASLDAYAYPLGRPELAAKVAGDGTLRLDGLDRGPAQVLVFDDTRPDGTRRAELVELVVPGGGVARFERQGEKAPVVPAAKMALAGVIVATVALDGGGVATGPRFAVEGTDLVSGPGPGGAVVQLGQLPVAAGVYRLTAAEDGYLPAVVGIDVASATNAYDVPLAIDTGGAGPRGCGAVGGGCLNGLTCDGASGRCVQCLAAGDCPDGSSCDQVEHFCAAPAGGTSQGGVCATCTSDAQCLGGTLVPARCQVAPLASVGFCTWAPSSEADCPAGFSAQAGPGGELRCIPGRSCAAYFADFGQACFGDEACQQEGAIVDGVCHGAAPDEGVAGSCTATCRLLGTTPPVDTCVVPGFTCDPGSMRCLRR